MRRSIYAVLVARLTNMDAGVIVVLTLATAKRVSVKAWKLNSGLR